MIPYCTSIHANVYRHRSLSGRTFRPRNIKILEGSPNARKLGSTCGTRTIFLGECFPRTAFYQAFSLFVQGNLHLPPVSAWQVLVTASGLKLVSSKTVALFGSSAPLISSSQYESTFFALVRES